MIDDHPGPSMPVAPGSYRLDPERSQVHYSGKHMFGLGTVHATFSVRDGAVRIGEEMRTLSTDVTVDAASFHSDSPKRDRDVRSGGLLDVDHFPSITFASEGIQETPEGWLVPGTVAVHGRSVPVDLQVDQLAPDGSELRVHGWARRLDRTAFGITGSRGMVGRYLDLEIDVVATPS